MTGSVSGANSPTGAGWPEPATVAGVVDPVLALRGVRVVRGGAPVLDQLDWTVYPGQRWVVLGGNGAGKTTLLQVAAGTLVPDAGQVSLGADLAGLAGAAAVPALSPAEPVADVVAAGAWGPGETPDRSGVAGLEEVDRLRAQTLLGRLGCRALTGRTFSSLSDGERQRVLLSRALMADPELLLLDEPAAGLDLGGREALLRMLARLARDPDGPCLVLVTHHVEEVPVGFTHALLLRAGRVVAAGEIATTLTAGTLSACFGLPVRLVASEGRYFARVAR